MNRTIQRQRHILESKYFQCKCARCKDPTELNTNMSTVKCPNCDCGYMLSENLLGENIYIIMLIFQKHQFIDMHNTI